MAWDSRGRHILSNFMKSHYFCILFLKNLCWPMSLSRHPYPHAVLQASQLASQPAQNLRKPMFYKVFHVFQVYVVSNIWFLQGFPGFPGLCQLWQVGRPSHTLRHIIGFYVFQVSDVWNIWFLPGFPGLPGLRCLKHMIFTRFSRFSRSDPTMVGKATCHSWIRHRKPGKPGKNHMFEAWQTWKSWKTW